MTVAEVIAASLCWLDRFKLTRATTAGGASRAQAQIESYWHATTCRYCPVKMEELMAKIVAETGRPEWEKREAEFKRLDRKARAARVREAQEEPWYEAATRS